MPIVTVGVGRLQGWAKWGPPEPHMPLRGHEELSEEVQNVFWKENKVCYQKTQTISRTQSKPNLLEGHNVFWGFIPLFFTYTVLSSARAELGFELNIAKYHKGEKKPKPFALNVFPGQQGTESPRKLQVPCDPNIHLFRGASELHSDGLGVLTAVSGFLCYFHSHRYRKGSQQFLCSSNLTTGLVRRERLPEVG